MKSVLLWILFLLISLPTFAMDMTDTIGQVVLSSLSERQMVVARKNLKEYRRRALVLKKIFKHTEKTRADQRDVLLIIGSTEKSLNRLPTELSIVRNHVLLRLSAIKQQVLRNQWKKVEEELQPWANSVLLLPKV